MGVQRTGVPTVYRNQITKVWLSMTIVSPSVPWYFAPLQLISGLTWPFPITICFVAYGLSPKSVRVSTLTSFWTNGHTVGQTDRRADAWNNDTTNSKRLRSRVKINIEVYISWKWFITARVYIQTHSDSESDMIYSTQSNINAKHIRSSIH